MDDIDAILREIYLFENEELYMHSTYLDFCNVHINALLKRDIQSIKFVEEFLKYAWNNRLLEFVDEDGNAIELERFLNDVIITIALKYILIKRQGASIMGDINFAVPDWLYYKSVELLKTYDAKWKVKRR